MSWPAPILSILKRLQALEQTLTGRFVDRDEAVKLLALAAVSREHLLLLGPPGTGKTDLVSRFTGLVRAQGFQYLITRFTEPSEVFGPLDLKKFHEGVYHIATANMLPEAEVAFLDELFQGNSAILNGFLSIANERVFHNGPVRQWVPLLTLVGASNDLPEDPALRAFADRFLLRAVVTEVAPDRTADLVARGWGHERERIRGGAADAPPLSIADLAALHQCLTEVKVDDNLIADYAAVVNEMRQAGAELSDRRAVRGLKLVAAAALLDKRDRAEVRDLWPLRHVWTRVDDRSALDQVLGPRLKAAGVDTGPGVRPATDVEDDLDVIEGQEAAAKSDAQVHGLLARYNRLRIELDRHHPGNGQLATRARDGIQRLLTKLTVREDRDV